MSKPKAALVDASRIDPQEWLSNELRDRFKAVLDQRDATLDANETDGVHDMRVAIRRLRSLTADFSEIFDAGPLRQVRKLLKKTTAALGRVRDEDVYIKALGKLHAKVSDQRHAHAVEELIGNNRELREKAYKKLTKPLSRSSLDELSERFYRAIDTALDRPGLFRPADLTEAARRAVSTRLTELIKIGRRIYDPADQKGLHKFRIAVKRLRYSLEAFAPVLNGAFRTFADEVAKLQSLLGDIHDCDVWTERLSKHLKKNEKEHRSHLNVLALVLSKLVKRRSKKYRQAIKLWSAWESGDQLKRLDAAISNNGKE